MSRASRKAMCSVIAWTGNLAFCNDCSGKGFLKRNGRTLAHSKCPRCKGAGRYQVGSTKR